MRTVLQSNEFTMDLGLSNHCPPTNDKVFTQRLDELFFTKSSRKYVVLSTLIEMLNEVNKTI